MFIPATQVRKKCRVLAPTKRGHADILSHWWNIVSIQRNTIYIQQLSINHRISNTLYHSISNNLYTSIYHRSSLRNTFDLFWRKLGWIRASPTCTCPAISSSTTPCPPPSVPVERHTADDGWILKVSYSKSCGDPKIIKSRKSPKLVSFGMIVISGKPYWNFGIPQCPETCILHSPKLWIYSTSWLFSRENTAI